MEEKTVHERILMLQLWVQSEILAIVAGKCLINNYVVSSAALFLEREEGIYRKSRINAKLVKDVLKCLKKSDVFDSMSVMMQMI